VLLSGVILRIQLLLAIIVYQDLVQKCKKIDTLVNLSVRILGVHLLSETTQGSTVGDLDI